MDKFVASILETTSPSGRDRRGPGNESVHSGEGDPTLLHSYFRKSRIYIFVDLHPGRNWENSTTATSLISLLWPLSLFYSFPFFHPLFLRPLLRLLNIIYYTPFTSLYPFICRYIYLSIYLFI